MPRKGDNVSVINYLHDNPFPWVGKLNCIVWIIYTQYLNTDMQYLTLPGIITITLYDNNTRTTVQNIKRPQLSAFETNST